MRHLDSYNRKSGFVTGSKRNVTGEGIVFCYIFFCNNLIEGRNNNKKCNHC